MKIFRYIVLFIAIPLQPLFPDDAALPEKQQSTQKQEKEKWGLVPFAAPFYTPETSLGIGGALIYYHNPTSDIPDIKTDSIEFYGAYTLLGQICGKIHSESYYFKDSYKLLARIVTAKYPDKFYGVGPTAKDSDEEDYTPIFFESQLAFMRETLNHLYIGPYFPLLFYRIDEAENDGLITQGTIPGSDGTDATGVGLQIDWDKRDSPFYARKGFQLIVRTAFFHKNTGSEYNFTRFYIDYRAFVQIFREHIICFQAVMTFSRGTVPFQLMPKLGGCNMMRGYYEGRFRDKNYISFQSEYRFSIYKRLGGAIFGSCGEVAPDLDSFNIDNIKVAFGTGLRFNLKKKEHINLRIDAGFDSELAPMVYFVITEAF